MSTCHYLIYLFIVFINVYLASSCGCYGRNTCTPDGLHCRAFQKDNSCLCDCCPACNDCQQLLQSNCFAQKYLKHYTLSTNHSKLVAKVNESINSNYIINQIDGTKVRYLWNPCFRQSLPDGINLIQDTDGYYKIDGAPQEKLEETSFEIIFKGPVNQIISFNFTLTVI